MSGCDERKQGEAFPISAPRLVAVKPRLPSLPLTTRCLFTTIFVPGVRRVLLCQSACPRMSRLESTQKKTRTYAADVCTRKTVKILALKRLLDTYRPRPRYDTASTPLVITRRVALDTP